MLIPEAIQTFLELHILISTERISKYSKRSLQIDIKGRLRQVKIMIKIKIKA
jgi:hypothetical protein